MTDWQLGSVSGLDDAALTAKVVARFRRIQDEAFAGDLATNSGLGVQIRALRHSEDWCIFLLLTPWMLARFFLPQRDPGLALDADWGAAARAGMPYVVIGPAIEVDLLGGRQFAHLNHDALLGHYLVQPLVLSMNKFATANEVFEAWNGVLATRSRIMELQLQNCPWQRELSRREFFACLGGATG